MNIESIRAFVDLSYTLNFTKTADKFGMHQPNLSRLVKGLEKEYGIRLFERTSRKAALTSEGEILSRYFREALRAYDEGIVLAQQERSRQVATIRMDNSYSKHSVHTLIRIAAMQAASRKLPFRIKSNENDRPRWSPNQTDPLDGVVSSVYDAAVVYDCSEVRNSGLETVPLFREPLIACLSEDDALANRTTSELSEFQDYTFVYPQFHKTWDASLPELCEAEGFKARRIVRKGTLEALLTLLSPREMFPIASSDVYDIVFPESLGVSLVPVKDAGYRTVLVYRKEPKIDGMDSFVSLMKELAEAQERHWSVPISVKI